MVHPLYILTILCANLALTEWLVRRTFFRHFGTALLVILVTALTSNLGIIPAAQVPIYDGIFSFVAPMAIFLLLLEVNLRDILKAGLSMVALFVLGAMSTVGGVLLAMWAVDGRQAFGTLYGPLGGMFTGTYTGGSVNFNALALHYGVMEESLIYAGSVAVDNILTAVWMVATLVIPRGLSRLLRQSINRPVAQAIEDDEEDRALLQPLELAILLGLGLAAMWISGILEQFLAQSDFQLPSIIILTTLALILAQLPMINRLRGSRPLGMFAVYLFLAVIGALCDLSAVGRIGPLGITLFSFASIVILTHGCLTFGLGILLRMDQDVVAVASQANIGGSASALALARSLGRRDLLLPSILVGSLGYGMGTYLGYFVAEFLRMP